MDEDTDYTDSEGSVDSNNTCELKSVVQTYDQRYSFQLSAGDRATHYYC